MRDPNQPSQDSGRAEITHPKMSSIVTGAFAIRRRAGERKGRRAHRG
jgi:hypothetical protein